MLNVIKNYMTFWLMKFVATKCREIPRSVIGHFNDIISWP